MTGCPLRLVVDQPECKPTARTPALQIIKGGGIDPWDEADIWRHTPSGKLLPRTHRWRRIRLSTWRATKEWRGLSAELDQATDAIASAQDADLEEMLMAWRAVAAKVILCKSAPADDYSLRLRSLSPP